MDWFVYDDGLRHESVKFLSLTIKKGSRILSTKVNIHFHDMVKIHIKIIQNVNIFTLYGTVTSHRNFNENLPK